MARHSFFGGAIWFATMLMISAAAVHAADDSPDSVLKAKGLTRSGTLYLLQADIDLPKQLKTWDATQAKYKDTLSRRSNLERDIRSIKATLDNLGEQNLAESDKLDRLDKRAYGSYNHQVDIVNGIREKIRDGLKISDEREKTLASLSDPTDDYTAAMQDLSQNLEATSKLYEQLNADESVTGAITQLNISANPKVALGPSAFFVKELPMIRRQRDQIVPSAIRFDIVGGVPHVPVTLNDSVKTEMVVDSGAAMILLTSDTAKDLDLQASPTLRKEKLQTADGTVVEAKIYNIASVRLGSFVVENVEAGVLPDDTKGADNLLGGTFLRHFVYKMDLAAGSLRLTQIADPGKAKTAAAAQKPAPKPDAKSSVDEIIVEAYIDGDTELHLTPKGIYWKSNGVSKPGTNDKHDAPTYINGEAWWPEWGKPRDVRAVDQSKLLELPIGSRTFDFKLLGISKERGKDDFEKRDPITLTDGKDEQILTVPDHQFGARWYTIRLTSK